MTYKGYNIAIHELGHTVEQVFSLNRMDHVLLAGTPNVAFTEGFAFTFQKRDLKLLGRGSDPVQTEPLRVLDALWGIFEISGVALVDLRIWEWMYAHPQATAGEVRAAILQVAAEVWNEFFAPIIRGPKDDPILAIYSHIIDGGMYLPDYPLGGLIQFQMEEHFAKHGLAQEMERMCRQGRVTPAAWMQGAVGAPISAAPLLTAAERAVKALQSG
jgi:hypothetical protein